MSNDFLPFAVGGSANVLSQSAYAALTSLLQNGLTSGIVPSNELNKILRQPSIIASVIAQFIVAQTGQPAIDDGTTATLLANLATAVAVSARQNPVLTDTGAANAYVVSNLSAFTAYPTVSGLIIDVSITNANTGASTLNVDGLGTKPILGLGLQPLQGGELIVKGVACLMYVVASTVNSGNGAWIVMECTGGALQIAPATASQHAAQFSQVVGVVGSVRNLKADLASSGTTITFTADQIVTAPSLSGPPTTVSNVNQTLNVAVVGADGLDASNALSSGFLAIYEINGTAGSALLGQAISATTVAPTIYAGGHMPSGYTNSALIAVVRVSGGSMVAISIRDRTHIVGGASVFGTTTVAGSATPISISAFIPYNAVRLRGNISVNLSNAAAVGNFTVYPAANQVGGKVMGYTAAAAGENQSVPWESPILTPGTMWYAMSVSAGAINSGPSFSEYDI